MSGAGPALLGAFSGSAASLPPSLKPVRRGARPSGGLLGPCGLPAPFPEACPVRGPKAFEADWLVQSKAFEADSDGATVVLVKVADLAGIFYKATSGSTRIKRKLEDRGCDVYEVEEAGKHGRAKAHCCSVPDAKAVLGRFPS